ncbi:MAG: NERD domain-containing protein [Cryobacterium sp.]|nr:NERD domain-containing protein [Cryobacterium sp.]
MTFPSLGAANVKPGDVEAIAAAPELAAQGFGLRALGSIRRFVADPKSLMTRSWLGRLFGASPVARASQVLYRDAAAELAVADSVSSLGREWGVVHAIAVSADAAADSSRSRDDVSHVVAGPNGVFAVTTVNARGETVWVASSTFVHDGVRMPHLRDAEYNALRLSQQLYEVSGVRVEVVPVVVVANPRGLIINRAPRRVFVLAPGEVVGWVRSQPAALVEKEFTAITDAARALRARDAASSEAADASLDRFRAIRKSVGSARRARIAWVTLALVSGWALLVVVVLFHGAWL